MFAMQQDSSKEKGNISPEPSDATGESNFPKTGERRQEGEGSYRNAETPVNSKEDFGDDYESGQENEISGEEARTEKED